MSQIHIPGQGPSTARIAIIGDFPDPKDLRTPFEGPAGIVLNEMLSTAGINRKDCYVTNILKYRPPGGDLSKYFIPYEQALDLVRREINALNPNVILTCGELPLKLLTGKTNINNHRGSLFYVNVGTEVKYKLIPTLHPRELFNYKPAEDEENNKPNPWSDKQVITWDILKLFKESTSRNYSPEYRNTRVCKSGLEAYQFFEVNKDRKHVAVDIETFHTVPSCISFAYSAYEGMSFPLLKMLSPEMSRSDRLYIWQYVSEALLNPALYKIGQNFGFDNTQLEAPLDGTYHFGMKVRGFYYDTMLANKILFPELRATLQFLTSIYTNQAYYKDEGKGYNPAKDSPERLLRYNAMDACVTYEVFERQMDNFAQRPGDKEFFFSKMMPLHSFYLRMQNRGIRRDNNLNEELRVKYETQENSILEKLNNDLQEFEIDASKINFNSNPQIRKLLFEWLQIPERAKADEKTIDALLRNVVKDKTKSSILENLLKLRKVRKVIKTYINAKPSPDGKIHSGFRLTLETGRTSTSILKPPISTEKLGLAFQTLTKHGEYGQDLRNPYIPDPGYVFIEPDLSQAEARVIAVLAKDEKLQKMFKWGLDIHRITSDMIENLWRGPELELFFNETNEVELKRLKEIINNNLKKVITDESRQVGKKGRHAANLGIGKGEFSSQLGISEYLAGKILGDIHRTNPLIQKGFHRGIEDWLKTHNRILTNPFGRSRQFLARWGRDLFKEAYAQLPQSTVSDQTKFAMRRVENRLGVGQIHFLLESHDSFLAQVLLKDCTDKLLREVIEEFEQPINFAKCSLIEDSRIELKIPCEMKVGMSWGKTKEIKFEHPSLY